MRTYSNRTETRGVKECIRTGKDREEGSRGGGSGECFTAEVGAGNSFSGK